MRWLRCIAVLGPAAFTPLHAGHREHASMLVLGHLQDGREIGAIQKIENGGKERGSYLWFLSDLIFIVYSVLKLTVLIVIHT